jgi:hypothetical protein
LHPYHDYHGSCEATLCSTGWITLAEPHESQESSEWYAQLTHQLTPRSSIMSLTSPIAFPSLNTPVKRKAAVFEDDAENVDPVILSPKRSKCPDSSSSKDSALKPVNFFLTRAPPLSSNSSSLTPTASPRRPTSAARYPAPRINTEISKPSPLSAPAGRSPTRKRIGILNRRLARIDPPKFGASNGLGFSIDAALSGTIPGYGARRRQPLTASAREKKLPVSLHQPESKHSWYFDIHEDTAEELATNLMEHSTCTLDISSDEESRLARMNDARGKENVPPLDDISQTRTNLSGPTQSEFSIADVKANVHASRHRRELEEGAIEIDRRPLSEMAAEDFYGEGCDGDSVVLIPADPSEEEESGEQEQPPVPTTLGFSAEAKGKGKEIELDVDQLMRTDVFNAGPKAALLEPIEKAEVGFQVWESESANGDEL